MNHFFISISLVLLFSVTVRSQIDNVEVAFGETNLNHEKSYPYTAWPIKTHKNKIRASPNRLDYRFEYLNALSLQAEWNKFTNEVIKLIEYSYKSDHKWARSPGIDAIGPDAEEFLLDTIEDYIFMLYITGEPAQFDHLRAICEVVMEFKPDHEDFLTYPAMTYEALGDYEAGMAFLQNAEIFHPHNAIVSLLMAENYEQRGMINAALAYYRKAARSGKDDDAKEAMCHIERLGFK